MDIRDDRDIYIAFANFHTDTDDVVLDERKLPFSRNVITTAINTTIEKLRRGEWEPIHFSDREKEIEQLRVLAVYLKSWCVIAPADQVIVDKINRIGFKALYNYGGNSGVSDPKISREVKDVARSMHIKYVIRGGGESSALDRTVSSKNNTQIQSTLQAYSRGHGRFYFWLFILAILLFFVLKTTFTPRFE